MFLEDMWAKMEPFQSVWTHGVTVGILAQTIYRNVLSPGNRTLLQNDFSLSDQSIIEFIGYWTSLHDIGKIDYVFQCKNPEMKSRLDTAGWQDGFFIDNSIRHEKTSVEALKRIWKGAGIPRKVYKRFALLLGAHHQGKAGIGRKEQSPQWCTLQSEFEKRMRDFFFDGEWSVPGFPDEEEGAVSAILLGILILADWIASGDTFGDAQALIEKQDGIPILRSRAEKFFISNGFLPADVLWSNRFCEIWPNITEEGRRPIQVEIEKLFKNTIQRSQLILVEAPMGEGKTEAGMFAAFQMQKQWEKNGFYVALPTSATSNQMVERMRNLMKMHGLEDNVRLLHAMAWLVDDSTKDEDYRQEDANEIQNWLAPVRKGLLSPYAVGTVDQAMLAATQVKYGVLRLLGLSTKVLIIDEIHSYDAYMNEIIKRLLEWCKALRIPVVMLSATLTEEKKRDFLQIYGCKLPPVDYPSIISVLEDGSVSCVNVPSSGRRQKIDMEILPYLNDVEAIARTAISAVQEGGCICVLTNTVAEAQAIYRAIRTIFSGRCLLFHAQFPAVRRAEIERECISLFGKDKSMRPDQAILVATQVVEQSLDVDFDGMITAVAPVDLLLQRLGRVHRHKETARSWQFQQPKAWLLVPGERENFGVSEVVYPKCLLQQSVNLLKSRSQIILPEDIPILVEAGYDITKADADELNAWYEKIAEDSVKAAQSQPYLLSHPWNAFSPAWNDPIFDDAQENSYLSVKTRLGEPNIRVALVEEARYHQLLKCAFIKNGVKMISITDHDLIREILNQSVSINERRINGKVSQNMGLRGDKLLAGLLILSVKEGVYCDPGGLEIHFDTELGVMIKDGEL